MLEEKIVTRLKQLHRSGCANWRFATSLFTRRFKASVVEVEEAMLRLNRQGVINIQTDSFTRRTLSAQLNA